MVWIDVNASTPHMSNMKFALVEKKLIIELDLVHYCENNLGDENFPER